MKISATLNSNSIPNLPRYSARSIWRQKSMKISNLLDFQFYTTSISVSQSDDTRDTEGRRDVISF